MFIQFNSCTPLELSPKCNALPTTISLFPPIIPIHQAINVYSFHNRPILVSLSMKAKVFLTLSYTTLVWNSKRKNINTTWENGGQYFLSH